MRVAEYRDLYASLRDLGVGFHACVDRKEREAWSARARQALRAGFEADCRGASDEDRVQMAAAIRELQASVGATDGESAAVHAASSHPHQLKSRAAQYNRSPGRAVRIARAARSAMRRGYF